MEPGFYLVVPFGIVAAKDRPPQLFELGADAWIATRDHAPVDEWLKRMLGNIEEVGWARHEIFSVKRANHCLVIRLPASTPTDPHGFFSNAVTEDQGARRRSKQPLPPEVNRAFSALLVAGRTDFAFTVCFMAEHERDRSSARWGSSVGWQGRSRELLSPDYPPEPVGDRLLERARAVFANLSRLPNEEARPAVAADAFRRAIFEEDWRMEIILMTAALEPLFSPGEGELSHQICERAAAFVCDPGTDRVETYRRLKAFYGLRSKLVHGALGGARNDARVKQVVDALDFIEDVVRKSLYRILTDRGMIEMFCASHDTKLRDYFLGLLLDPCFAHRAGNHAAAPE